MSKAWIAYFIPNLTSSLCRYLPCERVNAHGNSNSGVGVTTLVLNGALDQYCAETLKQELLGAVGSLAPSGDEALTLNMSDVDHLDASGLQVLMACAADLGRRKLRLLSLEPAVLDWLRIAGAEALFEIADHDV